MIEKISKRTKHFLFIEICKLVLFAKRFREIYKNNITKIIVQTHIFCENIDDFKFIESDYDNFEIEEEEVNSISWSSFALKNHIYTIW